MRRPAKIPITVTTDGFDFVDPEGSKRAFQFVKDLNEALENEKCEYRTFEGFPEIPALIMVHGAQPYFSEDAPYEENEDAVDEFIVRSENFVPCDEFSSDYGSDTDTAGSLHSIHSPIVVQQQLRAVLQRPDPVLHSRPYGSIESPKSMARYVVTGRAITSSLPQRRRSTIRSQSRPRPSLAKSASGIEGLTVVGTQIR
ncbi:hypothetical protein J8273_3610 [Carpediemonas membranifera]|uniref:Uncharacterized protein n=1 Tax=Carpediemonas membranifera TaxID=201153 RepID=A0A8J6AVE1_9EUKA|nr:hypothetical protein J8273_3610 [Carpediemonas membranifera]|eukprot:KAG9393470.1 hypothetical protein J8273_3610 [Carpediemonas membranifera]